MDKTVTMAEFSKEVAKRTSLTAKDSRVVIDAVFDTITDIMREGDYISVVGFGAFKGKQVPEETFTTPLGEKVTKPERILPKFTFSKKLKKIVEGAEE